VFLSLCKQQLKALVGVLSLSILLCGCADKPNPTVLVVGTMAGPETELVEVAQTITQTRYGLTVKIIEFSDYNLPNAALQDGTLDMNIFQHLPYLQDAIQAHHYTIEPIGKTFLYPMAIYSQKVSALKALPTGAVVAIPNDPSNEARALLLLQNAGLIQLKHTHSASLYDIKQNPHHYQFRELDAAQLPRVLADVDIAVINTNFAIPAGLNPKRDALFTEDKSSPYANLIVIKNATTKKESIHEFIEALHSQAVLDKAKNIFAGAAIPAW
jgi:D-methionine transport system substrate-binding protein